MRQPRCKWLERDDEGRPRCEHGWAHNGGSYWRCPMKASLYQRAYRATEKGQATAERWDRSEGRREAYRRYNATPYARSTKAVYDLTRVR